MTNVAGVTADVQLTNDGLHVGPHGVKGCVCAALSIDVLLEGCHADRLRGLSILRPQIHNILLQAKPNLLPSCLNQTSQFLADQLPSHEQQFTGSQII